MIQGVFTLLFAILFPLWALRRWPGWKGVALGAGGAILVAIPAFIALAYLKKLWLMLFPHPAVEDPARFVYSTPTAIMVVVIVSPLVALVAHLLRTRPS
jgi:hypothetical protein